MGKDENMKNNDKYNKYNKYTNYGGTNNEKNDVNHNRSSSLNRARNTEIFDIYTNKTKSLLPIDIKIGHGAKPKLGAPSIRVHYDEDFNPSTSPSPSSSMSSNHQQFNNDNNTYISSIS